MLETECRYLIIVFSPGVCSEREEGLLLSGHMLGETEQKDLPVRKDFTRLTNLLLMGYCLCLNFERGEDPPLIDQSEGEQEERDLPVRRCFKQIAKLLMMGFCLCVDFKKGVGPTVSHKAISHS